MVNLRLLNSWSLDVSLGLEHSVGSVVSLTHSMNLLVSLGKLQSVWIHECEFAHSIDSDVCLKFTCNSSTEVIWL